MSSTTDTTAHTTNFIRKIIDEDLENGRHQQICVRFPPEPNGFLHLGHAKSIHLNFGLAKAYLGQCHLRFDDTNPAKEEQRFIDAIKADIQWLGYSWGDHLYHTADYFEQLHQYAISLIKNDLAYIDDLSLEEMRAYRGTLTEPGKNSPNRDRDRDESLALFEKMYRGECAEGDYTLRAKIDMASPNINLRDPIIYRIKHATHPHTGDAWHIYPMYDFAHSLSDAIEGITHSLCTLEFQDHRPLYEWFINHCKPPHQPRQIEFSRLNVNYTITSKRKLKQLVDDGHVDGWDDPRMPTLTGLRRRGYSPNAIKQFCDHVGISKNDSVIDFGILEDHLRDDLNQHCARRMVVLNPIKVVLTNWEEGHTQQISIANHPQNDAFGQREVAFSKTLYIDRDDFMLDAPAKFFRLKPNGRVRLRNAYVITCHEVIKDQAGNIIELHCQYDPETFGGRKPADGKKVKGIIQWVNAELGLDATVRLYDRLFNPENPSSLADFTQAINPDSLQIVPAKVEPSLANVTPEACFQFTRLGYFCADRYDCRPDNLVFNRSVALKNTCK